MNPELTQHYQELVDIISSFSEDEWQSFKLKAKVDEDDDEDEDDGLVLNLCFIVDGQEVDSEQMTSEVSDVIGAIQAATPPEHAWSEWVFHFHRDGRYDITVKYPDDAGTGGNG